jgi:hypothetical protein
LTKTRCYVSRACGIVYMGQGSWRGSRTFVPGVLATLQERCEVSARSQFLKKICLSNGTSRHTLGAVIHKNKLQFMYGVASTALGATASLEVPISWSSEFGVG